MVAGVSEVSEAEGYDRPPSGRSGLGVAAAMARDGGFASLRPARGAAGGEVTRRL